MWGGAVKSQAPWGVGPDVLSFIPGLPCSRFVCADWGGGVQGWDWFPEKAPEPDTGLHVSRADPQFIRATIVHQDQAYDDKIYYFFREDNPDKNPEAPLNVSRVAQLCRVSGRLSGGVCVCA